MNVPDSPQEFFPWLKTASETLWQNAKINYGIAGFQIQPDTKWLQGLSEKKIQEYETCLGFTFPEIYKSFLQYMNGTDIPAINVYANSGEVAYAPAFYSFPRDLASVKDKIAWIYEEFAVCEEIIRSQIIPHILPVIGHRFLIADNCLGNPVLSMYGRDAIPYAPTLQEFLVADIFHNHSPVEGDTGFVVKFWLDDLC